MNTQVLRNSQKTSQKIHIGPNFFQHDSMPAVNRQPGFPPGGLVKHVSNNISISSTIFFIHLQRLPNIITLIFTRRMFPCGFSSETYDHANHCFIIFACSLGPGSLLHDLKISGRRLGLPPRKMILVIFSIFSGDIFHRKNVIP